jgi:hypothetical protein
MFRAVTSSQYLYCCTIAGSNLNVLWIWIYFSPLMQLTGWTQCDLVGTSVIWNLTYLSVPRPRYNCLRRSLFVSPDQDMPVPEEQINMSSIMGPQTINLRHFKPSELGGPQGRAQFYLETFLLTITKFRILYWKCKFINVFTSGPHGVYGQPDDRYTYYVLACNIGLCLSKAVSSFRVFRSKFSVLFLCLSSVLHPTPTHSHWCDRRISMTFGQ